MDRSARIPDEIITRLITGLHEEYRQRLSVGYPRPTKKNTDWAFPIFIQLHNIENFQVLGLQHHFTQYGPTVYDVTLTSFADQVSINVSLIVPKNLDQHPLPPRNEESAGDDIEETYEDMAEEDHE